MDWPRLIDWGWFLGLDILVFCLLHFRFFLTNIPDLPLMRFDSSLGVTMVTRCGSGSGTGPGGMGLFWNWLGRCCQGRSAKLHSTVFSGDGELPLGGKSRRPFSFSVSVWSCLFGPGPAGDGGVELSRPARRSPHAPRGSKGRRMRAALGALNCLGIEDVCGSRTVRGSSRNRQSVVRPLSLVARSFVCETCAPNLFGQLLRQCQMRMPDRARIRLSTLKSHPSRPLPVVLREQGCGCVAAPVKRFPIREGVGM
jgi:hypothetical protein